MDTLRAFLTPQTGIFDQKHRRCVNCQQALEFGLVLMGGQPFQIRQYTGNRLMPPCVEIFCCLNKTRPSEKLSDGLAVWGSAFFWVVAAAIGV
ncbi:hypothetical protein [Neisseria sp.]|uniref:hypothetical protein n=1 Tax=Neisseria sp. TaxID=192066 RepID=UPI0026DBEF5D|nr:hypothetical protein [Neisseria sp.]MDO4906877.1 hypothetical protein [Neisseria sp.]